MQGQISNDTFWDENPNANLYQRGKKAITSYGKNTVNYWIQHPDNSWTNYSTKTTNIIGRSC